MAAGELAAEGVADEELAKVIFEEQLVAWNDALISGTVKLTGGVQFGLIDGCHVWVEVIADALVLQHDDVEIAFFDKSIVEHVKRGG